MAKGCGNNSIELWYYGKGNISNVTIPITYATGAATQSGTTVTGAGTAWTDAMIGHSFDFSDGTLAGRITGRSSQTFTVTTNQTVGDATTYTIKDRGTYALSEAVNLSATKLGVGRGAAFKVDVRPQAGTSNSELDSVTVLGGGLNYKTQLTIQETASESNLITTTSAEPVLGGSSETATIHGKVSFTINDSSMWHQAKTFDGTNSIITTEIEYMFNSISNASVTLMNRSADISSLFSNYDSSGQYTDFFHEGQEILLRDHTTHITLFRGTIQELEDTFEMGIGQVVQLHAADMIKEWDDIPAEIFDQTSVGVDLPSAKIYSIIENKIGRYQSIKAGERRIAFGEGPLYKGNSSPTGAVFPYDSRVTNKNISGATEGKIAAKRGYGHQVGRRFAFENSWFPRDDEHFSTTSLTAGESDEVTNERDLVGATTFNKGKQKVLSAIQNLASQEPHGEYRRTDGEYIKLDGSEAEWAFHVSPNILSPTPEILGTSVATDGQNDSWITSNSRIFTPSAVGDGYITIASISDPTTGLTINDDKKVAKTIVAGLIGFYPSDIGKSVKRGATTLPILGVSEDHTTLYTLNTTDWGDGLSGDVTISEDLDSIPQFNYFEAGSRPAFSFGKDELASFAESEQDVRRHSVTMLSPKEPVAEQGISVGRATASQQSGDRITQPAKVGTGTAIAHTKIEDGTTYPLKVPLHWEVQVGSIADATSTTTLRYRYIFAGTDITNIAWIDAGNISLYVHAAVFEDLSKTAPKFNVQIRFETTGTYIAGDSFHFYTYPQFDNTRALKIMGPRATFSNYSHEKYSSALVYYDAEAAADADYGSSARMQAELIYGWGVQNRSWILSTSANIESGTTDYTVRVHHGDASDPHNTKPKDGDADECINFSGSTTARTSVDDFAGGDAFEKVKFGAFLGDKLVRNDAEWNDSENGEYKFRDFYWHDKQLTEGALQFTDFTDFAGASRGGRASEYLDLYRGRYSVISIAKDDDGGGNTIPDKLQIEWRRWESGENIAAVQYVDVPARQELGVDSLSGGVHPVSEGGSKKFPFAAGDDETKMVKMLISFHKGKTKGQPKSSGGEDTWPTTNTYDDTGKPQSTSTIWYDFPYVRLVGQTTGTKFDFDADVGKRQERHPWQGRPIDTWQALRPLRKVYQKDNAKDAIRLDLVTALHKRTSDMRIGKFITPKAPYYWLEAQVDGFTESGSNNYGDDTIDPSSPATTNPNATKTIRFKLQHIGATTGTKYYNPLQYGLMIGNIVRFYNHEIGTGGAVTNQNFEDSAEFCYGVITDIQPITTSPQYYTGTAAQNNGSSSAGTVVTGSGTTWTNDMVGGIFRWEGYPTAGEITGFTSGTVMAVTNTQLVPAGTKYVINKQNEDTFDMCGWIEVELPHTYRKAGTTDTSVTGAPVMMGSAGHVTYNKVTAQTSVSGNYDDGVTSFITALNDPGGIDASVTSITAADKHGISPLDIIKLGTEKMLVTNVSGATLTVERDYDGTTAALHLEAASITLVGRAYGGPTRVRVYNMLYPGYAVFVEDVSNGISAKHVIEGMRFTSRQGVINTEYHTSGKKTDHTIRKWGTTPLHPRTSSRDALEQRINESDAQNNSGIGQGNLNPVEGLTSSTDFYFETLGGGPDEVWAGWKSSTGFIK